MPHLDKTYLDGALFTRADGTPVIGMTLRYDRADNFWFVLFHELGHLFLGHLTGDRQFFADDMDLMKEATTDYREDEADGFAVRSLLPPDFDLDRRTYLSNADVVHYARGINRHPGVVAGRIQFIHGDYRTFSRLVGRNTVRRWFADGRAQWN